MSLRQGNLELTKLLLNCTDLETLMYDCFTEDSVLMYICKNYPESGLVELFIERSDCKISEVEEYLAVVGQYPQLVYKFRKIGINNKSLVQPKRKKTTK